MRLRRTARGVTALLLVLALGCSEDSTSVSSPRYSERSDSSFVVSDSSVLEISNFAGKVTVTPGNADLVDVIAEKWARRHVDLDEIEVEMVGLQNGVRIRAANPLGLNGASVDLVVMVPGDARPAIEIAAGEISYEGLAEGECIFGMGAGTITLKLPVDVNVEVYLVVGAGSVRVDYAVIGQVSDHVVDGVIGTGVGGRIVAQVAAGDIIVTSQ